MAVCSLRDRHLKTQHENMNPKTQVSPSRAPSHSPQGETSKKVPRVAAKDDQKIWMTMQVSDRAQLRPALLQSHWDRDYSPRLRNAERGSLAHGCMWGEAPGEAGQGQALVHSGPDKSKACHVWYFRL